MVFYFNSFDGLRHLVLFQPFKKGLIFYFLSTCKRLNEFSTIHVPGACRGQEMVSASLELALQMVMRCHVGTGN